MNSPSPTDPEQIWNQHAHDLRVFVAGFLRGRDGTEDILQRTALQWTRAVHSGVAPVGQRNRIRPWLFRVALNEARQHLRGERREARKQAEVRGQRDRGVGVAPGDGDVEADGGVSRGLLRKEVRELLIRAIHRLPESEQRIVQARLLTGATFEEIAESEALPLGTVLSRMHRAVGRLRRDAALRAWWTGESS